MKTSPMQEHWRDIKDRMEKVGTDETQSIEPQKKSLMLGGKTPPPLKAHTVDSVNQRLGEIDVVAFSRQNYHKRESDQNKRKDAHVKAGVSIGALTGSCLAIASVAVESYWLTAIAVAFSLLSAASTYLTIFYPFHELASNHYAAHVRWCEIIGCLVPLHSANDKASRSAVLTNLENKVAVAMLMEPEIVIETLRAEEDRQVDVRLARERQLGGSE